MTDVGGLVRSVNPAIPGQSLLADDELDALLVLINERKDEADIQELPRRVQPMRPRRRGWLVAAAVAVVVLVVLGSVLLLAGDTEPDVGSTESDVATSVPLTTALQATTPLDVAGWSRVPHDEAVFGGATMNSVTVGGPGLVAVGATDGWVGDGDAAVWTSPDGITWTRVPHDETVFGGANSQTMWDVTVGGPGLVAVGWDGQGILDDNPDVDAAIWTSLDGVTWSRVPHDEAVFGAAFMWSVTAGGPGLVAVGWTGDGDIPDQNAAVLTSVDGITWSKVPHDEAVFGGSVMSSVTVGGPGLVAVGQTEGYWTDTDAVVWTSVDGITWSRVAHDETIFGGPQRQTMYDVIVGGPGLVAVGRDGDERPWDNSFESAAAVWTSIDGIAWTRIPHDETVFGTGGNKLMLSVTAGGPGLVAVGAQSPGGPFETPVWTSPDGFTWTRVPDDVTVRGVMAGVTTGGPGLVAVGLDTSGATAVWTSVDGITWSQVPHYDAVFGRYPDWISDVTVGGPGLVAVGIHGDDAAVWVWEAGGD